MLTPPGHPLFSASRKVTGSPLDSVRDLILLHVKNPRSAPVERVSSSAQGIVFSGRQAREHLSKHIREHGMGYPLVLDPSAYEKEVATPDSPFALEPPSLYGEDQFAATLSLLEGTRATLSLTPTKYLYSSREGVMALRRAVEMVNAVETTNLILSVPIDTAWLTELCDELITLLNGADIPTALILGSKGNPVDSERQAASLCRIIQEIEDIALLRTDMTAIDAMVHGAVFSSIGDTSSTRRTYPPPSRSYAPSPSDRSPNVLVPGLLAYYRGSKLAYHLRADTALCSCWACVDWADMGGGKPGTPGRPISGFQDKEDQRDAHAHNLEVWSGTWRELRREENPFLMRRAWSRLCSEAIDHHERYNRAISLKRDVFIPRPALRFWANHAR